MNIRKLVANIATWAVAIAAFPFTFVEWLTMIVRQIKVYVMVELALWSKDEGLNDVALSVCEGFRSIHDKSADVYGEIIDELK